MSLVLYAENRWYSPYVYSVFVALKEKGVPFEVRELSLDAGDQHAATFVGALTAKVPAIEHDGFWLGESSAIVEYLDEVFPDGPMLPRETRARARARQIMAWLRTDLAPLREARPTSTIFYDQRATAPLEGASKAAAEKLARVASELLRGGRAHLFESFGASDAELALMLQRLVRNGDPLPAPLRAWAEAQWARPSVRAFVEHARAPLA
jgi:glutathione S-transferase